LPATLAAPLPLTNYGERSGIVIQLAELLTKSRVASNVCGKILSLTPKCPRYVLAVRGYGYVMPTSVETEDPALNEPSSKLEG
jgi:hypothetical protein